MKIICAKTFFITLASMILTLPAFASGLTYDEALNAMLAKHGNIMAAADTVSQAELEKESAFGLHMPTLTLDARYTYLNDKLMLKKTFDLPAVNLPGVGSVSLPPFNIDYQLQKRGYFNANANLTWPVFTGGKINAANSYAQSAVDSAKAAKDSLTNQLVQNLVDSYFSVQLAKHAAALRLEVYNGLRQHYSEAVKREEAGLIPQVEVLHAEVSMYEAERSYKQALQDIDIATAALSSLIGGVDNLEPTSELFMVEPDHLETLEYYRNLSTSSSPQIAEINSYLKMAKASNESSDSTYWPNVYLFGTYELYRTDLTLTDPDWAVGVGASWVIFEGFSGYKSALASKKASASIQNKKIQVERDMQAAAEVYYKQLLKAYEQYNSANNSLKFTNEYLRIRTRAFEAGMATSVDVVDANMALSRNKFEVLNAVYNYDIALSKLLALCGLSMEFDTYMKSADIRMNGQVYK